MTYEQVKNLKPTDFKRLCGVSPQTFQDMVKVLSAEKVLQKKTGRPSKLKTEDQILITLEYWREYRTYFHIGNSWGINETTALRMIRKVEDILIKSGLFDLRSRCLDLPGKKVVQQKNTDIEMVVVDVAEHDQGKTKKKQKMYYSGKQGYHTLKSRVLANPKTRQILCTAHGKGRVHDFNLWKSSQIGIDKYIECLADKGYQGIQKIHALSRTPYKKKPNQKLSLEEKKFNHKLASERIIIENIHEVDGSTAFKRRCRFDRSLKIFRILSSRYRNRRRRFGLRFNLIAGIYNYELSLVGDRVIN